MTEGSGKDQNSALEAWLSRKKKKPAAIAIEPKPAGSPAVLSHGQERLWLLEQLYPDQNLYHYAHRYRIEGELNQEALSAAFQQLAERHEIIRSSYQVQDGKAVQFISNTPLPIKHLDLRALSEEAQVEALKTQTKDHCAVTFDLEKDALFRVYFFQLSDQSWEVLIVLHHIIGDAWSMGIINQELGELYSAENEKRQPNLDRLNIQYQDFAWWQRKQAIKDTDLDFWKEKLSGELPILNLPKKSASGASFSGKIHRQYLPESIALQLKQLAKQEGVTMYALMLACFKLFLSKYCDQSDIIVGSPFSNRDQKALEKLVGFFNETLVLRTEVSPELSFKRLLESVKDNTLEALSHKNVPFDSLVNALNVERQAGENPLFQTMFLYNAPAIPLKLGEAIQVSEELVYLPTSKFDLTLFANEKAEGLELVFEYSTDLEESTIETMGRHFQSLVKNILVAPEKPVSELSLFSPDDLANYADLWEGKKTEPSQWKSVHALIAKQASEKAEQPAVVTKNRSLSYAELDRWSDQVAAALLASGIQANQFVGILSPRSVEMVVGILGTLKAGAAYLPLDPDYPQERLDFMLKDSGAQVVLVHPQHKAQVQHGVKLLTIEEKQSSEPVVLSKNTDHLDHFAYVIYTSGSTGKPKGVPVTHRNLLHSTAARFSFFEAEMKRFLLLSSFSFDSSIAGIFWSLCSGGTLVLPEKHIEQDISALTQIIEEEKVSHTLMLPSLYQVILGFANAKSLASLEAVMVAGEACAPSLRDLHFAKLPHARLYNEYGPTEATVWCIAHEITPEDEQIPIGRPIENTRAYILNAEQQPLPIGAVGELYIGGQGVTKGYLNRPELTKERFLSDPFVKSGGLMYKTGDLTRFRSDGIIEFLGRADQQVKIRGFRVEPEEIRNRILEQADISEAAVKVLEENGNKQLVAWIQTTVPDMDVVLRSKLKNSLPDYMVPSHILLMAKMPKLPNGKVDAQALPSPKATAITESQSEVPKGEKEVMLLKIWQEVLDNAELGTTDNFFNVGGDSILSIRIVAKAREQGLKIGPTDIFKYQDIQSLARNASWLEEDNATEEKLNYPISFPLSYQQQAFLLHSLQSKADQGFLQLEFSFHGTADEVLMQQAWQKVIDHHPVMRTSFHWQNTEELHQTIHEQANLKWQFLDFSQQSDAKDAIINFKQEDSQTALDLTQPGGGRISLIKLTETDHLLIWTSHHILIDGWSGAIILEDVLAYYDVLLNGQDLALAAVPHFGKYLEWKQQQEHETAKSFWQKMLQGTPPPLFSSGKATPTNSQFRDQNASPDTSIIDQLQKVTRQERLTINSLLQGLWMITLASYFDSKEVSLGLTLTGRSSDFKGIDRITGLLMNVLPVRKTVNEQMSLAEWLNELQSTLNQLRQFEHIDTDQVQQWTDSGSHPLFDSLFVFGNFMSEALTVGSLTVDEFKGGFSATFPLTLRVNPAEKLEINCRYDASIVSDETAEWLLKSYESLLEQVAAQGSFDLPISALLRPAPAFAHAEPESHASASPSSDGYAGIRNSVELQLLKIWETVIGTQLIGIHDNYFEVGGTSLGAIKLFAEIEKAFGQKLPPTTIVQHSSIAALAALLGAEANKQAWTSIVPMKTSGEQLPLFCLHSGGAHVLFYQGLAKYMSPERPVYAIQPTGIDGEEEMHENIAEMATHYIAEMQKIQPEGPYHLIGTCFGNAVGIEMANQLKEKGEELAVLYVIDSAPAYLIPPSPNGERKPVSRMMAMVKKGDWRGIIRKFRNRYIRLDRQLKISKRSEQEIELDEIVDSLNHMYVNYTWRKVEDKVVLIRSSEFSQRKDKGFHLERWRSLAGEKLEVYEVEGKHLTLFEEPEVQGLTRKVAAHLESLENT